MFLNHLDRNMVNCCMVLLFSRFVLSELASSERDYVEKLEHCIEVSAAASHVLLLPCHVKPIT